MPEAPEMPTVREVYATNALVLWNRPRDGGKPITNYILEKKEPSAKRWSRATRDPLYPATQYRVQDLVEGCEYEFRVMAENELGTGDPSVPSKPILAKDPIGQCHTKSCCISIIFEDYILHSHSFILQIILVFHGLPSSLIFSPHSPSQPSSDPRGLR